PNALFPLPRSAYTSRKRSHWTTTLVHPSNLTTPGRVTDSSPPVRLHFWCPSRFDSCWATMSHVISSHSKGHRVVLQHWTECCSPVLKPLVSPGLWRGPRR